MQAFDSSGQSSRFSVAAGTGGRTYTESKEVVGGLFIIEADSSDEAVRIASMHPAATLGEEGAWAVELIPMDFYLAL